MSEKTRTQNAMLNISFSLISQFLTVLIGLVIPQLMIKTYGSEINGLIASITQFLSFISLLEAGAGGVIRSALYSPLSKKDMNSVSGIYNATKGFFRKIGFVFILYIVALCFLYPIISKTEFEFGYVVLMILILSIGTGLQYFLGLTNYSIIVADQKAYISHAANIVTLIINFILSYVLITLNVQIHIVKLVSCIVFAIKPIFYTEYVKRKYRLDKGIAPNGEAISQRWNGLVHHLAYFLHTNIDVVFLTIFLGTGYVSIYTVYMAVVGGIKSILMSISEGISSGVGNLIATESREHIGKVFERFEFIQTMLIAILFSITASMIIPFMQVYTKGITDYNYVLPLFGFLIVASEAFYCVRCIYTNFSLAAGKYKETQIGAIIEAVLNLIISLILIQCIGMVGIAIGTLAGMLLRMIFDMYYTSKYIVVRPIWKTVRNLIVQLSSGIVCVIIANMVLPMSFSNWLPWVLWALAISCGTIILVFGVNFVLFRRNLTGFVKELFNNFKRIFKKS